MYVLKLYLYTVQVNFANLNPTLLKFIIVLHCYELFVGPGAVV